MHDRSACSAAAGSAAADAVRKKFCRSAANTRHSSWSPRKTANDRSAAASAASQKRFGCVASTSASLRGRTKNFVGRRRRA